MDSRRLLLSMLKRQRVRGKFYSLAVELEKRKLTQSYVVTLSTIDARIPGAEHVLLRQILNSLAWLAALSQVKKLMSDCSNKNEDVRNVTWCYLVLFSLMQVVQYFSFNLKISLVKNVIRCK